MIIWYPNSILASIVSILGCASILGAVGDLMQDQPLRELSMSETIMLIIVGVGLMILGKIISLNKAKKQQTQAAPRPASQPAAASQPRPAARPAEYAPNPRPVRTPIIAAGIFFLLTAALSVPTLLHILLRLQYPHLLPKPIAYTLLCLLLMIGSFCSQRTKTSSVLHGIGFLGLSIRYGLDAWQFYLNYGFGGYSTPEATYYYVVFASLFLAAAYILMTLFSFFTLSKEKGGCSSAVRALWWLPTLLMLFGCIKELGDSNFLNTVSIVFGQGYAFGFPLPFFDGLSLICEFIAVCLTSFSFQRFCRQPAASAPQTAAYAQPAPEYAQPAPEYAQPAPEYAQPAPEYAQPAPEYAQPAPEHDQPYETPVQTPDPEREKLLRAYQDLLDNHILTQAEYDQKVRDLMRG